MNGRVATALRRASLNKKGVVDRPMLKVLKRVYYSRKASGKLGKVDLSDMIRTVKNSL